MKLSAKTRRHEVSDEEIERDVLELRRLLEGLPEAPEPHPAYWQNFLVHVRSRIDERGTRRRWAPSMAWTTVTAAAVVVVLAVAGVLPTINNSPTPDSVVRRTDLSRSAAADAAAAADPLAFERNGSSSIILSTEDVSMLKAIMADDEAAMLMAMVESPG